VIKWKVDKPLDTKWAQLAIKLRTFFRKIERMAKATFFGSTHIRFYLRNMLVREPLVYLKQLFVIYEMVRKEENRIPGDLTRTDRANETKDQWRVFTETAGDNQAMT
jgi:hypothetical protein